MSEGKSQKMPTVEHLFNASEPTKSFECFKDLNHCKDLSEVS